MRILIAEDDMTSRIFMKKFLSDYGECEIAVDGVEAVELFTAALEEENPYDLVCLDIMMPRLDGLKVLKTIRGIEKSRSIDEERQARIIMTTAINDKKTVMESYEHGCQAYAWKPINVKKFKEVLKKLELID